MNLPETVYLCVSVLTGRLRGARINSVAFWSQHCRNVSSRSQNQFELQAYPIWWPGPVFIMFLCRKEWKANRDSFASRQKDSLLHRVRRPQTRDLCSLPFWSWIFKGYLKTAQHVVNESCLHTKPHTNSEPETELPLVLFSNFLKKKKKQKKNKSLTNWFKSLWNNRTVSSAFLFWFYLRCRTSICASLKPKSDFFN